MDCRLVCRLRRLLAIAVVGAISLGAIGHAAAEADGPDFNRVVGVAAESVLNIRAEPSARARKIGTIPAGADGIRNLGCRGGLSFEEWRTASPEAREAGRRARWCRIAFDGMEGWVAGWFLAEGSALPAPPRRR
jgi:uncharacterized protein YraI